MIGKVKVRIQLYPDYPKKRAFVWRQVENDHNRIKCEVLADNGKWRAKAEYEAIFEDEKLEIEEWHGDILK